jgi:hypothetical protein
VCGCTLCAAVGLPMPVDSLHAFGDISSVLPFDRYMVSSDGQAYEYDPLMQRTMHIGSEIDYFMPPIGGSITYVPGYTFGNWSTSTLWTNGGHCQSRRAWHQTQDAESIG